MTKSLVSPEGKCQLLVPPLMDPRHIVAVQASTIGHDIIRQAVAVLIDSGFFCYSTVVVN